MSVTLLTAPPCEPLHINDVRQHIKQDITDDDNLIQVYLTAARMYAEGYCRKQFIAARYLWRLDAFPSNEAAGLFVSHDPSRYSNAFYLPNCPLIELESIQYIDTSGQTRTMPASDYVINYIASEAVITPVFGKIWPIPRPQIGAVWLTYKAGYVAQAVFDSEADTVTLINWAALEVGEAVRFTNSGGALPAGITAGQLYYIKTVLSVGVYQLATTPDGEAIPLDDAGTGLHFVGQPGRNCSPGELPGEIKAWLLLRCDTHYSYRGENVNTRGGDVSALPYVDRLLDHYREW